MHLRPVNEQDLEPQSMRQPVRDRRPPREYDARMGNRHAIGLGHLSAICQMAEKERLSLVAEGLPLILASSEGFQAAAEALRHHARESDVLEGFAAEEAAKTLILMDMLRCPKAERNGTFVRWFYNHLARLIYADAVSLGPTDRAELRSYANLRRRSHETGGAIGEYIVPCGPIPDRERRLYVDLEKCDDGQLMWNSPRSGKNNFRATSIFYLAPGALRMARAMQKLGMFSETGLGVISDVWGAEALSDEMTWQDGWNITMHMLTVLDGSGAISEAATDEDASFLLNNWPLPMCDFDLNPVVVPIEELESEREHNLWNEVGWER